MLEAYGINSFYGGAHILHDVSLKVGAGEAVALLGRNGAGKSTILKSLMGLVEPRDGAILFKGEPIIGLEPHIICQQGLGFVPEDRRVFSDLSVEENLEVGRRVARGDIPLWTTERLYDLFPNLSERRRHPAGQLSGGEQQMLSIARTLMGNPQMILLDEPSEGIAPVIVEQMARVIGELKEQGLSVLLSEQNMHFARLVCDRCYIIEQGVMRYDGDFDDLDANPQIWQAFLAV